ncbi:MAG: hypothetical protein J6T85_03205, partial [Paludibacteraceae bacterium]|nr:hypothetical protein [Paludibacteraceae bacterium]
MKLKIKLLTIATALLTTMSMSANTVLTEHLCLPAGTTAQYLFGCQTLNSDGVYTDHLTDIHGNDSIVELHFSIGSPSQETLIEDSIISGQTYLFGCQAVTDATDYYDYLTNASGCDSTVHLRLKYYAPVPLCEPVTVNITDSIVEGQAYLFGCTPRTAASTYTETFTKADGCDSVVNLTLKYYVPVPPCEPVTVNITDSIVEGQAYLFGCTPRT